MECFKRWGERQVEQPAFLPGQENQLPHLPSPHLPSFPFFFTLSFLSPAFFAPPHLPSPHLPSPHLPSFPFFAAVLSAFPFSPHFSSRCRALEEPPSNWLLTSSPVPRLEKRNRSAAFAFRLAVANSAPAIIEPVIRLFFLMSICCQVC